MTTFKITRANQGLQLLESRAGIAARLVNTTHGWIAHRGASGSDAAPVNVSRMINQHDGAAQIAAALGLAEQLDGLDAR